MLTLILAADEINVPFWSDHASPNATILWCVGAALTVIFCGLVERKTRLEIMDEIGCFGWATYIFWWPFGLIVLLYILARGMEAKEPEEPVVVDKANAIDTTGHESGRVRRALHRRRG